MKGSPTKNICFFNSNKAWGGGEKWHFTMCQELSKAGFNTFIVTNTHSQIGLKATKERLQHFAFQISSLSFINPVKVLLLMMFFRIKKIDTLIMNLPQDLKCAGIAAKLARVNKIIYRRGMPHPLRNTWLNRFLFKNILTQVIVNSEEIGRSLSQGNEEWFPKEKLVLIYNGMNLNQMVDQHQKLYQKKSDEIVIGNAGRLTSQKGQKYLIEMAQSLKQKGIHFKLLIAGEGELKSELSANIKTLGLEENVTLLGHVSDMTSFMNSIDLFVFPSLFEGAANTLIETLFYEKPIVAFNVSSNPEIIEHGFNGMLAKAFEVDDLTNCTLKLIEDESLREKMAMNGKIRLAEKFDQQKILENLKAII
jgi:glycosyltransferase involved in cell wall biosynthesis